MPAAERMPLDDILSDREPQAPAETDKAPSTEVSTEAPQRADRPSSKRAEHRRKENEAQGRDPDTGQFKPKEPEAKAEAPKEAAKAPEKAQDKPAAAAQPEMTERERGLLRAAEDERRKRQDLERRLAEAPKTDKPKEPEKKFWDDPEGHFRSAEQRQQAMETQSVLRVSEIIARSRYPDFDEKIKVFGEVVQQTPGLAQQWLASADPAEFAYKLGKNHLELRQAGNIDKLRGDIEAKARADERAKVEAEFKAKMEDAERKRSELPGSLSDIRGAGSTKTTPAWVGPTSLTDILKH